MAAMTGFLGLELAVCLWALELVYIRVLEPSMTAMTAFCVCVVVCLRECLFLCVFTIWVLQQ